MTDEELVQSLASGRAWEEFCDALRSAGEIIRTRAPDTDLDRAEGYRYLTRLTRMAFKFCIEHANSATPALIQYMDETQKFGVDNPDQLYQWARISGKYRYRLSGPRGTAAYLGIGIYAGSAGRGGRRTVAHLNDDDLTLDADGRIDVLLSTDRQSGDWVELAPDTTTMLIRQTMNDRTTEVPASLTLERLDATGPPPPLDPVRLTRGLGRAAMQIIGSAQTFADLSDRWAERPNFLHPRDDKMANESFGDPDLYYAGGYWRLADDEALVIDLVPPQCRYWSFLLCNYWTESLDYRYRNIWTNKHRATYRPDGSVRIIAAAADPHIPATTWLDTERHREGTMTLRWLLADATPIPSPRVVRIADLAAMA